MLVDLSNSVAGAPSCSEVVVAVGAQRMTRRASRVCSVLSNYTWQFSLGVGLGGRLLPEVTDVAAAPWNLAPLCFSLHCRFVSRIFVVPDHPELLLSSSGVSVLFCRVHLRVPFSGGLCGGCQP